MYLLTYLLTYLLITYLLTYLLFVGRPVKKLEKSTQECKTLVRLPSSVLSEVIFHAKITSVRLLKSVKISQTTAELLQMEDFQYGADLPSLTHFRLIHAFPPA